MPRAAMGLRRRRSAPTLKQQVLAVSAVVATCLAGLFALSDAVFSRSESHVARLLEANATAEDEDAAVCGELQDWELNGGVAAYIAALCYIFVALAIIADDYFVASLEKITDALSLSPDVAGATFMAAGSSSPELFVSLADNVFHKPAESLGAGTIVGSAIFNILIIISMSALLSRQVLVLDWRPLLRDSLWYSWAIVCLTYGVWDGKIDVLESAVMVGSYVAYIIYMSQNHRIVAFCCKRPDAAPSDIEQAKQNPPADGGKLLKDEPSTTSSESEHTTENRGFLADQDRMNPKLQSKYRMFQYHSQRHHDVEGSELAGVEAGEGHGHQSDAALVVEQPSAAVKKEEEEELGGYFDEVFDVPSSCLGKLWFVITRPIVVVCRLTIPDCRYPIFSGKFGIAGAFLISIAWIGVLSHFTVEFGTKVGCIAHIPSALMGLTIIAVGMSIPDALSSILVARDGQGDMAVSNALGSNVFDILLGVGLPFLLSNLVYHEEVPVSKDDLDLSIFILFGVLLFVVLLLILSKWRLYRAPSVLMVLAYIAYVAFSYLHGLGKI